MIIHETKQEPNKKGSNSTILSKNHPDEHNRQTNGQNTQDEYKYQQSGLGTVSNELLGGGGGLNRFYRALTSPLFVVC